MQSEPVSGQFRVFLSSPSGLDPDRAIVVDEINLLSESALSSGKPGLSIIRWPDDIAAAVAGYGQSVINSQTSNSNIFVCLIGARMGTPTPRANSGTEEEFDRVIEAKLRGDPVQVLLFFNDLPVRPQGLDANQLLLTRAFREKAGRLGVLYHLYGSHEELRQRVRNSLHQAYDQLCNNSVAGVDWPRAHWVGVDSEAQQIILTELRILSDSIAGPQGADSYIVPLAEYRRQHVRLTWTMRTNSTYFRFGFKYYDSRELLYRAGSVQTEGQNVLFHLGKNEDNPAWFATAYRSGYRMGPNVVLEGPAGRNAGDCVLDISPSEKVLFSIDGQLIYEAFFPLDGIPALALLAWGDEHKFRCEVSNLVLHTYSPSEVPK